MAPAQQQTKIWTDGVTAGMTKNSQNRNLPVIQDILGGAIAMRHDGLPNAADPHAMADVESELPFRCDSRRESKLCGPPLAKMLGVPAPP